jgi:hypothetical protein
VDLTEEGGVTDTAALGRWIQPQHLDASAMEAYRERFASDPARVLHLEDFLLDDVATKLNRFLADEAEYDEEYGIYSVEGAITRDRYEAAPVDDRFFRLRRLAGIPDAHRFSPNALTYLKLRQTFQTPAFETFFAELTGLELGASDDFGTHRMIAGDYLRAHSDDNRSRRLALVMYLTPDWRSEYGGSLLMVDPDGNERAISATYNSIVMFDVLAGTSHSVEAVSEAAGDRARLTIGGWYHRT